MSEYNLNFVDGLIPVVVQDYKSGDVLTLAYMNKEALDLSLKQGMHIIIQGQKIE